MPKLKSKSLNSLQLVPIVHRKYNYYRESELENIVGCLGVTLNKAEKENFIRELIDCSQDFMASRHAINLSRNMNIVEMRSWIATSQQALEESLNVIERIPFQMRRLLIPGMHVDGYDPIQGKKHCVLYLRKMLFALSQREHSLQKGKGQKDKEKKLAERYFIRRLKNLYENVTHRRATRSVNSYTTGGKDSGKFITFLSSIFQPLQIRVPSGIVKSVVKESSMAKPLQK